MFHVPAHKQVAPAAAPAQFVPADIGVECALMADAIRDMQPEAPTTMPAGVSLVSIRADESDKLRSQMIPVLTAAVQTFGFDSISPDSLTHLMECAEANGWESAARGSGHGAVLVRACFQQFMEDGRRMFAPL